MYIVHLHFLREMNLQFSTIAMRMHFFIFYMQICAYFGVRVMSIGVDFVLVTTRTLKRNLMYVIAESDGCLNTQFRTGVRPAFC